MFMLILLLLILISAQQTSCSAADVLFSSLPQTLMVSASPKEGQVLKAGEDRITITWRLNQNLTAGTDESYKTVELKLCYAPVSQEDRGWRKTEDNLSKDKTCQYSIADLPYKKDDRLEWAIERDVPGAVYFVRAYVHTSAADDEVAAYGQTTDAKKTNNLFEIKAVSGRNSSLDTVSAVFSAFAVVSFFGFVLIEKRRCRRSATKG